MAELVQAGNIIDYVATENLVAGSVVVVSGFIGVTNCDVTSGGTVGLSLSGVYEVPFSGTVTGQGSTVYWNATSGYATNTSAAGVVVMGKAAAGVVSGGTVVQVRLNN